MTQIILPKLNQTGANEWSDVQDNDVAIRDVVNGNLDNANLSGAAGITDANLASPNNSVYRTLLSAKGFLGPGVAAATYVLGSAKNDTDFQMVVSGTSNQPIPPDIIYFASADFAVPGKTQKLRMRAQVLTNAVAPGITFTIGLYPLTVTGASSSLAFTLGAVVTNTTVAIASPSASSVTQGASSDVSIPGDGAYALGIVTSGSLPGNGAVAIYGYLQTRHT